MEWLREQIVELRNRSHDERQVVVYWGAIVVTSFVALIWVADFRSTVTEVAARETEKGASPFALVKDSIEGIGEGVSQITNIFK